MTIDTLHVISSLAEDDIPRISGVDFFTLTEYFNNPHEHEQCLVLLQSNDVPDYLQFISAKSEGLSNLLVRLIEDESCTDSFDGIEAFWNYDASYQ